MSNNEFTNSAEKVISLYGLRDSIITNNTIDDALVSGILVRSQSTGNTISDNTISNVAIAVVLENEAHANTISGNTISDVTSGFFVEYSDDNIFEDNTVSTSVINFGGDNSSPLVYTWNGTEYDYVADVGQLIAKGTDGTDYAQIDQDALVPKDGVYSMNISQEYNEIVYYDALSLLTFDHVPGYTVVDPLFRDAEYADLRTVSDTPTYPLVSCVDMYENDCTADLVSYDHRWSYKDQSQVNSWILDFGDLSGEDDIQLVMRGARDYSATPEYDARLVEVIDENGEWVEVYSKSDIGSDGTPRLRTIDLSGKFLSDDYRVRVSLDTYRLNYFAVDTSPQVPFVVNEYKPTTAELSFRGYTAMNKEFYGDHDYNTVSNYPQEVFAPQSGNFTKYGEVASLLDEAEDHFVVMHHGDHMSIEFPYVAPAPGMERSFILYNDVVYKHANEETGNSVTPLPFNGMSVYPYEADEAYPMTEENSQYLEEWNTRVITEGFGFSLPDSIGTIVRNNTIVNATSSAVGDIGIYMFNETSTEIYENEIARYDIGIQMDDSTDITIRDNDIHDIETTGVFLNNVSSSTVANNSIEQVQSGNGISIQSSDNIRLLDNELEDVDSGIASQNTDSLVITGNSISTTTSDAISLNTITLGLTVRDNTVTNAGNLAFILSNTDGRVVDNTITIEDNDFESTVAAFTTQAVYEASIIHNTFRAPEWVNDDTGENSYNNSQEGNTYYLADGTPSWDVYNILDNNGNGYADVGTDLPFSSSTLTTTKWAALGSDAHPATEVNYTAPQSGGSSSSSGSRSTRTKTEVPSVSTASSVCSPYIKNYLRYGELNNVDDMKKLETFLNEKQGEKLPIDGVFGLDDLEAVKRFQTKYASEVLGVWNLSAPTGYVYRTTLMKINSFYCNTTISCPLFKQFNSMTENASSTEVAATKVLLTELGFYTGQITNTFDQPLKQSLVNFQETFSATMLTPWGITSGTGYKYKTTNKFLNMIVGCKTDAVELDGQGRFDY